VVIALLFLALVEFAISNAQDVPWAQITAAPGTTAQYLDRRDYSYDTANSHLYGYTSVGMDGTRTQCDYTNVFCKSRNLSDVMKGARSRATTLPQQWSSRHFRIRYLGGVGP
jgi:hypothetical protein